MGRLQEIKDDMESLNRMAPANLQAPSLDAALWLIEEVERLRTIEDAANRWLGPNMMPDTQLKAGMRLGMVLTSHPRVDE